MIGWETVSALGLFSNNDRALQFCTDWDASLEHAHDANDVYSWTGCVKK